MAIRVMCGTPKNHCSGSKTMCNAGLGKAFEQRAHSGQREAFRCYRKWLLSTGEYEATDTLRELKSTTGGPRLVLAKQSHFGALLRKGKSNKGEGASRYQPAGRCSSGVII